jgi:hypothetical protein
MPGRATLLILALWCLLGMAGRGQSLPPPAIEWQQVYGGFENDFLNALQQTADGGFILGGTSYSPAGGNKAAGNFGGPEYWIVRLDAQGNHLWDRSFGGLSHDFLESVSQTADGGFIIGGTSQSGIGGTKTTPHFGPASGDYWVIRVDQSGNQMWEQNLGGVGDDRLTRVLQTRDGGGVVAGDSGSPVSGNKTTTPLGGSDYWVVRLDADGYKLWEGIYGGIYAEYLWAAEETRDGGFLLGGGSESLPSGNKTSPKYGGTNRFDLTADFWVVRLDASGNKLWDRSYGGTGDDTLYAIAELPDGGFALGGRSASPPGGNKTSPSYGDSDYWLVRTDASGNKLWEQTFGGTKDEQLYSLAVTTDGGLILGGFSHSPVSGTKTAPNRGSSDYWVIRLDADGNKLWEETYGGSRSDAMQRQSLQQTREGGFILGGFSYSPADGNKTVSRWAGPWCDFWLIKLAPEQPHLQLERSSGSPGGWRLLLRGVKNLSYAIEFSPDLSGWTGLTTNQITGNPLEIHDANMTNTGQRFYRARRTP